MPLHHVLQSMPLRLLKVITPVERVIPRIQEELGPLSGSDQQTASRQTLPILRDDKIHPLAFEVGEGLYDAVGRHDGFVGDHERFQLSWVEQLFVQRFAGVHDECG